MKKNYYYTPEVKFHKLQAKAAMLAGSEGADQGADDEELGAKGFGSIFIDEDEE